MIHYLGKISHAEYSWFSLTLWDGLVGVQNSGNMSRKFCTIIESNSQGLFFAIVLYTNMATVTSRENRESILFHAKRVAFS